MNPATRGPGRATAKTPLAPRGLFFFAVLALWLAATALAPAHAQSGKRIAFFIGNAKYEGETTLANPHNDAALLAGVFKNELRFDEVVQHRDLNRKQMYDLVREVTRKSKGADSVVVYYSGHGMRGGGGNYLIPIDARIADEDDVRRDALAASELVDALQASNARVALLILDACRDSPYSKRTKSTAKGLARMGVTSGNMLVAYATSEGSTADDGRGNNSPYAQALAQHLRNTSQPLLSQFDAVRRSVREATGNKQNPTREGDLETSVYLLASVVPEPAPQPPPLLIAQALKPGSVIKDCSQCPELVVIPAGRFTLGSNDAEQVLANSAGARKNDTDGESPQSAVSVLSFAAGKYAVTKGEFAAFVQAKGYQTEAETGDGCFVWTGMEWKKDKAYSWRNAGFAQANDHPVVCVSWNDTQAYIQWLNQTSGKTFRLLSEAEREYAARAGTETAFWWGDSINTSQANYRGTGTPYNGGTTGQYRQATVAVSSFSGNPFGLYNVHGNVLEWVEDCFHDNYSGAPTNGTAWTTGCSGNSRVLRGGSWSYGPAGLRSAYRDRSTPDNRGNNNGFRLARTLFTP